MFNITTGGDPRYFAEPNIEDFAWEDNKMATITEKTDDQNKDVAIFRITFEENKSLNKRLSAAMVELEKGYRSWLAQNEKVHSAQQKIFVLTNDNAELSKKVRDMERVLRELEAENKKLKRTQKKVPKKARRRAK